MKCKLDFSVVAMGDRDAGPDWIPHKSRYLKSRHAALQCWNAQAQRSRTV